MRRWNVCSWNEKWVVVVVVVKDFGDDIPIQTSSSAVTQKIFIAFASHDFNENPSKLSSPRTAPQQLIAPLDKWNAVWSFFFIWHHPVRSDTDHPAVINLICNQIQLVVPEWLIDWECEFWEEDHPTYVRITGGLWFLNNWNWQGLLTFSLCLTHTHTTGEGDKKFFSQDNTTLHWQ